MIEEARRLQAKLAEVEKALNMVENPFELFDIKNFGAKLPRDKESFRWPTDE